MKHSLRESWSLAFVLVGTLIGAGFATGQELYSFFLKDPGHPELFFLISCGLILGGGLCCCLHSKQRGIRSYEEYLCELFGTSVGQLGYLISVFFLLACFCVTASGAGVLFEESFHLPFWLGVAAILIISFATILYGMRGIVAVNSLLTPIMLLCILLLGSASFFVRDTPVFGGGLVPKTAVPVLLAFLYGGYNIFSVLPLSISCAGTAGSKKHIVSGFLIAFLCLAPAGLMILGCLQLPGGSPQQHQLPFLAVVSRVWLYSREIYGIVMYFAMITTAVSCFYGFVCSVEGSFHLPRLAIMSSGCVAAALTAFFPFSALVEKLYGFFGIFGALLLLAAIYQYLSLQWHKRCVTMKTKDVR